LIHSQHFSVRISYYNIEIRKDVVDAGLGNGGDGIAKFVMIEVIR
jgi:hypothetical protein